MAKARLYYWTLSFYILLLYAFYPAPHLLVGAEPQSLYQYLTEGFLSGHLHLSVLPSAELLNLQNPYDPLQNNLLRLHDASLYQGKYYVYFGLLPVLALYLPIKWLTGFYPSDALAVFLFLSLAFVVNFSLLIKIKHQYFPKASQSQLLIMGALMGLAIGGPCLLSVPRVYEVAIASAFCLMSIALFFFYKVLNPPCRRRDVFFLGLCLSLTVAGRPHFALVCLWMFPVLFLYFMLYTPRKCRLVLILMLLIPVASVAFVLGLYNTLRFGSFLDFGHFWQLSCNDIQALHLEWWDVSKIPRNLSYGFYYYFLQPFTINSRFPYFGLQLHDCHYRVDEDYYLEAVAGILTTIPFILILLALPKLLSIYHKKNKGYQPLLWFLIVLLSIAMTNVGFLLLLPFAIQRYEVDFIPYFILLSIITFWLLEEHGKQWRCFKCLTLVFNILAVVSIGLGVSFGLAYWVLV